MPGVAALESRIDDLYKEALGDFVARRDALAGTLTGADAKKVKTLRKPTVIPWVVNQLYWRARPTYDRIKSSGNRVRLEQIAALKGRSADVRSASEAHRKALAAGAKEGLRLAAAAGLHPEADELTRALEAVSLAPELPEPEGRLTRAFQPAGFEALAGIDVKAPGDRQPAQHAARRAAEEKARADAERRKQRALEKAREVLAAAQEAEEQARDEWERAKRELAAAELAVSELE
ncbi:MAG TPA: hypothetical protein VM818_14030 [Vicinamibacterales bacterium]|jgi:hypothetical protein|nr:hypothetical protein [Vicinamibacterales bacterium]